LDYFLRNPLSSTEDILPDGLVEKPMLYTTTNMLCPKRAGVEYINRTYAPRMVVAVLPVEEAVFPMFAVVVPLTSGVVVFYAEFVEFTMVSTVSSLSIDAAGGECVIDYTPYRHATGDEHGVVARIAGTIAVA
jgi:hypothetical protein